MIIIAPNEREVDAGMVEGYRRAGVNQLIVAARGRTGEDFPASLSHLAETLVAPAAAV